MNDLSDSLGTMAGISLFARVLEPHSGAKALHPDQPAECLNCATSLVGAYCHACGQEAHVHRSLTGFTHDLLHGAVHFEGKLWRTLPLLAVKPGSLTRRYIAGLRARFVSPMALFLFSVFLMFAVFQALGITAPTDLAINDNAIEGVDFARKGLDEELAKARATYAALPADDQGREAARKDMVEAEQAVKGIQAARKLVTDKSGVEALPTGLGQFGWLAETLVEKWRKHPDLMLYKLQSNSYKFSWLLIPLSMPFVWLLFAWKRNFNAYDHAIFVTYSLSFMSLLFVVISLFQAAGLSSVLLAFAAVLIPPLHMYKQLRGAYSLSRFSAAWRLLTLSGMIVVILALFLQVLLVLGAF